MPYVQLETASTVRDFFVLETEARLIWVTPIVSRFANFALVLRDFVAEH